MVTAARDWLARTLRADAQTAFSVELTAKMADLSLQVEGFGQVRFPVTPAKARKLASLGQPARFGRGEETVTDPDVRDTWEIPKHLVRAGWDDATLKDILATVKEELGLPNAAGLTADLHSLLIYEPNQFFLVHQDSEKDDSMVGTLVVTLPSSYAGGELMVGHNEEWKAYRGSKTALSLVAFYADCRHEVLRVTWGYRITLTYNLLLHGDTSRQEGDDGTVAELADLLREHFSTPVPRYYSGPATDPPNRLVYLLDHEYTPRGLSWRRLKGADASRVALLRSAADRAGCESVLALADIKTTHSAFADDEGYGYRDWYDEYDEDDDEYSDDAGDSEREYDVQELIDSEGTLTHWTGPEGTRLEETSLSVDGDEVCASTPTGDLTPYSSEYEGYMGNWGNTLDRWYHRAAVVVWPRDQAFANRAETSPAWALGELAAMASAGDVPGARAAAMTLAPFWDAAVRGRIPGEGGRISGLLGNALRAADALADPDTAALLLRPFRIESLTDAQVKSFAKIAGGYGQQWTAELLRIWFGGDQPAWAYGGRQERPRWVADSLPALCEGLHATGSAGTLAAQRLVDLAWEWLGKDIGAGLGSSPSRRDEKLGGLGKPLASVLTAAAVIGAAGTRDMVTGYIREQGDAVTTLEMSALRVAAELSGDGTRGEAGFGDLAADCAARLRTRLDRPLRASGDWSIELPAGGCTCDLCDTLRVFLNDKGRRTFEWPLAKQRRQHIHSRIDTAELPVTHLTRRQGSPYTLVLTKTDALFAREQEARIRDETDLEWLSAQWNPDA
jgi:predicted 2-oxoglutarate/Fe(II)-dependent dioxygenase YbiX